MGTTFDKIGHYAYTSTEHHQGFLDYAVLESPKMDPIDAEDSCKIRFFYNIHGCGAGNLSLVLSEDLGESTRSTTLQTFTGQGAGGWDVNQWKRVEQQIRSDNSHNIIFWATIGQEKKVGTIAIDDVTFTKGCKFGNSSPTSTPEPTPTVTNPTDPTHPKEPTGNPATAAPTPKSDL